MEKREVFCSDCDVEMEVIKTGYKIVSIGDLVTFETAHEENEKVIECIKVELSKCPNCGKNGLIDMGEIWLSKSEIHAAIKNKNIFSDNPELDVLFKFLT